MSKEAFNIVIGIGLVSTVLGAVVSYLWYRVLIVIYGVKRKPKGLKRTLIEDGVITGIVERAFFAVAIAASLRSVTVAMVAWTTLKERSLWALFSGENKPKADKHEPDEKKLIVSLLASLGSMVIAIVAGKICDGKIFVDSIEALRVSICLWVASVICGG